MSTGYWKSTSNNVNWLLGVVNRLGMVEDKSKIDAFRELIERVSGKNRDSFVCEYNLMN